ncbi:porin [Arhodomonas aquaeolei]|uniref:porin n=1 Tax=Arhodomonas aquaeolei TaxID=2369 RepID=UPI00038257C2|nr:porin [Arhodomonas aquaeolei]
MKKAISALAVAAALGASSAHAAEFRINEDTMFSVNGSLEYMYLTETNDTGEDESEFGDNDSTLTFEGEHAFENGLEGFFQIEYNFEADESDSVADNDEGINDVESAYAGVTGNFGTVQLGRWDGSLYEDTIQDPWDVFEYGGATNPSMTDGEDSVGYISPNFSGFSFGAMVSTKGDGESLAERNQSTDSETAYQLVAQYETGIFTVAAGYDDRGRGTTYNGAFSDTDATYGVMGSVDLAPVVLTAHAETGNDIDATAADETQTTYGLLGTFDYGMGELRAMVNQVDEDQKSVDDRTEFLVGATYDVSSNLYVWAETAVMDQTKDEGDYTAVGASYSF